MSTARPSPYLPFARPSITDREKRAVLDVLDSGWLTTGAQTKRFEQAFADRIGAKHAIAVNSATAGLHLALEAIGVGPGDEVIVPTWTFTASAEVVVYLGARPVLIDVDRRTLNATVEGIQAAVTTRTRAVMVVHVAGLPVDVGRLVEVLEPRGIAVIEDAAHAFPSQIGGPNGRYAGTFGKAGAYSFYATKTMTTGEGGMLATNDDAIAARARVMALHGISRDAWNRYSSSGSWYYEVEEAGFKYNMTDIAAALGLVQLDRADELFEARKALAAAYRSRLARPPLDGLVELPADAADGSHAWHLFIIRLALDRLTIDRAQVIDDLRELGIGTSVHFIPLHLHPYYQRQWGYAPADLPVATAEYARAISLPIWPGMTERDVERVVDALGAVLRPARRKTA
jgi:dTDP-4-amino-4,6-dideoxygalactose transaminase